MLWKREIMKMLRLIFTWPVIFAAAWYIFTFTVAAVIGLAYLYLITILLFHVTEKQKEKLVQIVEYIKARDNLIDPKDMPDFSTIETADDVINAIRKNVGIKK
jgi:hypothetical protein